MFLSKLVTEKRGMEKKKHKNSYQSLYAKLTISENNFRAQSNNSFMFCR